MILSKNNSNSSIEISSVLTLFLKADWTLISKLLSSGLIPFETNLSLKESDGINPPTNSFTFLSLGSFLNKPIKPSPIYIYYFLCINYYLIITWNINIKWEWLNE